MKSLREDTLRTAGLRERKKAKTRAAIQQHALRLFREQGYEATTVDQIAEAVEISPSTFFRYFPTKEDVVLYDNLDPLIIAAFEAQPRESSVTQALRGAMHEVLEALPSREMEDVRDRITLVASVPELRARMLDELIRTIQMFSDLVAKREGRSPDDFAVLVFTGAVIGVSMAVMLAVMDDPSLDFMTLMDAGLAQMEAGLSL